MGPGSGGVAWSYDLTKIMAQQRSRHYTVVYGNRGRLLRAAEENLQVLTAETLESGLISEETKKDCFDDSISTVGRAQTLVDAVQEKVDEEDSFFGVLVAVLRRIPGLAILGDQLDADFRKEIRGFSVSEPGGAESTAKLVRDNTILDSGLASGSVSASAPPSITHDVPKLEPWQGKVNGYPPTENDVHENLSTNCDDETLLECVDEICEGGGCVDNSLSVLSEAADSHPASIQEVGRTPSGDSFVTSSSGYMSQLSMGSSMSSADEAVHNLRMEVLQQKTEVSELQSQVGDLNQKLERTTSERTEALRQLEDKEAEVRRITEQKDTEIEEMRTQIEELHIQIEVKEEEAACYQHRIAEKERENDEQRERHEMEVRALVQEKDTVRKELQQTKCDYAKEMEKMERKLKDANACKEEAAIKLSQVQVSLANKEAEYNRLLLAHEQEIGSLRLQVAEQTTREANMRADLAECKLTIEKLRRRSAEKKHRDSLSRVEELEKELARFKQIPEDHSDNPQC